MAFLLRYFSSCLCCIGEGQLAYHLVMVPHLRTYVCALYAGNMSGEPKNKIGGRQYQTKPDQQEFLVGIQRSNVAR